MVCISAEVSSSQQLTIPRASAYGNRHGGLAREDEIGLSDCEVAPRRGGFGYSLYSAEIRAKSVARWAQVSEVSFGLIEERLPLKTAENWPVVGSKPP
jgi:hypothetical protein